MHNESKAAALRFLKAMGDYDVELLRTMMTETVTWWAPESASGQIEYPLVGNDRVAQLAGGQMLATFKPGTTAWDVQHMTAEDGLVAILARRRALRANGRPYDNLYHWLFRFEDGLIAEVWEVLDSAFARQQLAVE